MDLQQKIKRLKELKQRNAELNDKIKSKEQNYVKGKKATVDEKYIAKLRRNTIKNEINKTKGPSLRDYFKSQNSELYEELENEKQRKEYINSVLSMAHRNTNNIESLENSSEQNLDDINDISKLRTFANSLLETKTKRNTEVRNCDMSLTDDTTSEISSLTSSALTSEFEDLTSDDELYLTDSDMDYESEIEQAYKTINDTDTRTETIKAHVLMSNKQIDTKSINDTKSIIINPTREYSNNKRQALKNKKRMQKEIEILRNATETVKDLCFNYLKSLYDKLMKIIKIYMVMCRNDFIYVSNEIMDTELFGYKYVNQESKKGLTKGTLLKIIFVYNGKVEMKDFVVHRYNNKSRRLEAYYCNITDDEDTGEVLINKSTKITKIHPQWITFTRIKPSELIKKFKIK
jgi:hypothetical protein